MGAAAATLKAPVEAISEMDAAAGRTAAEDCAADMVHAKDSSRASTAASVTMSVGRAPSERSALGSRRGSGAMQDVKVLSDETPLDGESIPDAFMTVQSLTETPEAALDDLLTASEAMTSDPGSKNSVENRLQRVHAIMAELDSDERILMLEEESKQTRNLRVNVAKKLAQVREADEQRQRREKLNLRKEFLYQKAQTVELILEKRRKQVQLKQDIDRFESKEIAVIAKLGELRMLLQQREDSHKQACSDWEQKFTPVVGSFMDHVPGTKEAIRAATIRSSGVSINKDITRELQHLLTKTLAKSSSELYSQRAALHKFRLDLEDRMEKLRANNPGIVGRTTHPAVTIVKLLHEPGDRLIDISADCNQKMRSNILDFKDRISLIQQEADWLQVNPATQVWRDLENELSSITRRNEMKDKVESAHAFLSSWMETNAMRRVDNDVAAHAVIIKKISDQILEEVLVHFSEGVCSHVHSMTDAADHYCAKSISLSIASPNLRFLPNSLNLIQNHLSASATTILNGNGRKRTVGVGPSLVCCERNPIAIPFSDDNMRSRCNRNLSLKKLLMQPQDIMAIDHLIERERLALDDLAVTPVDGSLQLPGSAGELSVLRILPRVHAAQSLVVAGTSLGRFVVWTVPWSSGTDKDVPVPVHQVAYSPSLPMSEVSPMEDLKESPTSPNLIITLDKKCCVRVWTLNPPTKNKKHSGSAFSNNFKKFVSFVPACIFMITPAELNLPLPPPITQTYDKKRPMDPQLGVNPKAICFHPSCNFAGRNPSVMIGTDGGDLYKVNMDFKEPALIAPILHLKPFVTVEFPLAVSKDVQISEKIDDRGGNNVYRELFHFHKSPIIFLDVLYRASEDIISVDTTGVVAIWRYKAEYFSGSGWFFPLNTTYLDLDFLSHEPLPNADADDTAMLSNYTEKIECPPLYFLDTLKLWRRRRLFMPPGDSYAILETFFPIIESDKLEFQYERITMVTDTSAISHNGDEKGYTPRSMSSDSTNDNVLWMKQNMRRCLSGSIIHDVCMSDDGADIGILLSTMCYPRSSMYATALESRLRQQAAKESGMKNELTEDCFIALCLHGVVISLDCNDLMLHQSYIVFELDSDEKVLSLSLGPLQPTSRTRIALVKTSLRLRLFCTDSGVEISPTSGAFPFWYPKPPPSSRKQKFPRSISAVCPYFSVCAFGNNAEAVLSVYAIHHTQDGNALSLPPVTLSDAEKKKLRHRLRHVSQMTVVGVHISVANDIVAYIVNLLVDNAVDSIFDRSKKAGIIREIYGSDEHLGVIFPTVWPSYPENSEKIITSTFDDDYFSPTHDSRLELAGPAPMNVKSAELGESSIAALNDIESREDVSSSSFIGRAINKTYDVEAGSAAAKDFTSNLQATISQS